MYNKDDKGRRRSARNQGISPSIPSNNAPLDLLSDDYYPAVESNNETNDDTPNSHNRYNDNETHDLLSFEPINDPSDNEDGNSSNFLSSTSSPLYDQYWHHHKFK